MPRRIDVELTSERPDGTWTWRAAGAREPKGEVDASIVPNGAKTGDVLRADAEFHIDGIEILAIIPSKNERREPERIEVLGIGTVQLFEQPQLAIVEQVPDGLRVSGAPGDPVAGPGLRLDIRNLRSAESGQAQAHHRHRACTGAPHGLTAEQAGYPRDRAQQGRWPPASVEYSAAGRKTSQVRRNAGVRS